MPLPDIDTTSKVKLINDYSIIVQEYFQMRVEIWIQTVGKIIFGIKHHWLRYEFAPSRGQIHAHMLVICDNIDIQNKCFQLKDNKEELANFLCNWIQNSIGMTANISLENNKEEYSCHPSSCYFKDILEIDQNSDAINCMK